MPHPPPFRVDPRLVSLETQVDVVSGRQTCRACLRTGAADVWSERKPTPEDAVRNLIAINALPWIGVVPFVADRLLGVLGDERDCPACGGSGRRALFSFVEDCGDCNGRGTLVSVPPDLPSFVVLL